MLAKWLEEARLEEAEPIPTDKSALKGGTYKTFSTLRKRLQQLPPLREEGLWPAQKIAIKNLEHSLAQDRPRALIQMATGSGKTFTAITAIYRLIKFAGARRVLCLVDRGNLGDQTLKEFQQYVSPYNNFKFTEEFIVQRLSSNTLDTTARVCISTIQRMFSMLKGKELAEEDDEMSVAGLDALVRASGQSRRSSDKARGERAAELPDRAMSSGATRATQDHGLLQSLIEPIDYNPAIPIETFDVIITDECHRSIYNLWAQVLEYFDAYLIGLTATPGKQTFGFFNQNLIMEYPHEQAVADGVNVNYDVYRIRTAISEAGSKVDAGFYVEKRERETRKTRWEQLDDDFAYDPNQLDRDVVTPDQIRTIVTTFRDKLFTEIFPGRTEVPKTLVFAKDDAHAEQIVEILREEFAKGNDFAQKITYRTTGANPKDLIKSFRNSYHPRIAVTVDMIATGTDIKPLEIVMFMRAVKSRTFFEQMRGRGVRVISPDDLKGVTPDAKAKDHFVIVDCVGVCERDLTDSRPMDQKKSVPLEKLLQAIVLGNTEPDVLSSVAARLARLEKDLPPADQAHIAEAAGGLTLKDLARRIVEVLDPDSIPCPPSQGGAPAEPEGWLQQLRAEATKPLCDPKLRELILALKQKNEQVVDNVTEDQVLEAGFSEAARERARQIVTTFEQFIEHHKDEITALQILYSRPTKAPLTFEDLKALADALQSPPYLISESQLWQAYAALYKSKVKGTSTRRILTDLVSLVRYAMHQDNELVPYPERVMANFRAWMAQQETSPPPRAGEDHKLDSPPPRAGEGQRGGNCFTEEQRWWLEKMAEHIAANLGIGADDFGYAPFNQRGGMGKVYQLFGAELPKVIEAMNRELVA
jgi:type I restriction enzyme R subunit